MTEGINKESGEIHNITDKFLGSLYHWKVLFGEYNKFIYVFLTKNQLLKI